LCGDLPGLLSVRLHRFQTAAKTKDDGKQRKNHREIIASRRIGKGHLVGFTELLRVSLRLLL
jgi:hypothetical protein